MLHATAMHFAFLKAADPKTAMGKRILIAIKNHHDTMVRQQAEREEAKAKAAQRLATSLDVE